MARFGVDGVERIGDATLRFVASREQLIFVPGTGPLVKNGFFRLLSRLRHKGRQVEAHLTEASKFPCHAGGIAFRTYAMLTGSGPDEVRQMAGFVGRQLATYHPRQAFVVAYEDALGLCSPWHHEEDDAVSGCVYTQDGLLRTFFVVRADGEHPISRQELRQVAAIAAGGRRPSQGDVLP
jgi:hypothetical protein